MEGYERKANFGKKENRIKKAVCVILGICTAFLFTQAVLTRTELVEAKSRQIQQNLAEEVFRFHVLADSDDAYDQEVKLKVRDAVLTYMKESMPGNPQADETKQWARSHLEELAGEADKVLEKEGVSYRAKASVVTDYFPEKKYGDVTFPEGEYEALRIELGSGGGHNWWCVLYPNLCFMDTTCAVVSEEGKEELKGVLDDEEYEMVTASSDFKVKWFFLGDRIEE